MQSPLGLLSSWRVTSTLALSALLAWSAGGRAVAAPIKVSCIGEQTTHSDQYPTGVQPVGMQEYPAMLQTLLGSGYDVQNNGDCCASVIQGYPPSETHPYISGKNYTASVAFAPDIVVIGSWGRHDWGKSAMTALPFYTPALFQTDYEDMVKHYLALPKPPKIFASLPIPIPAGMDGLDDGFKTSPAADAIKVVAAKYNLPVIDLFSAFLGHPEFYRAPPLSDSEGEHVNPTGMQEIAQLVKAALTGASTTDGGVSTTGQGGTTGSGQGGDVGSVDASQSSGAGGTGDTGVGGTGDLGSTGVGGFSPGGVFTGVGGSSPTGGSGPPSTGLGGSSGTVSVGGQPGGTTSPGQTDTSSGGCSCGLATSQSGRAPWGVAPLILVGLAVVRRRQKRARSRDE
jgi:MYXO-CTERM domain-containing protein